MKHAQPDLFTGVFCPRIVLEDARLTAPSRLLYGALDGLGRTERGCFASNGYLAKICGVKPRQLRNLLAQLEALGYITRTARVKGGRTIKTVTCQALQSLNGGGQSIATPRGNPLPPYRKEERLNTPQPPLKGGRVRRRNLGMTKEGYANGF